MIPRTISLRNFLSYGWVDIDFSRGGMIALAGDNGAGKSALAVDAITWALWGDSRAKSDDDLVRTGTEECQVDVVVETTGGLYRISRRRHLPKGSRAGVSAVTLGLEDADGAHVENLTAPTIRETQDVINRVLGMDGRTFVNSACLVQGRADEFATAAPGERKDVLVDILALGRWQDWAATAHDRQRKLGAIVGALDAGLEAADAMLAGWDGLQVDLAAAKGEVRQRAARVASRGVARDEARVLAAAQRDRVAERNVLGAEVERLDDLVRTERQQVGQLTMQIDALPDQAAVEALGAEVTTVKAQADALGPLAGQQARHDTIVAEVARWEREIEAREEAIQAAEGILAQLGAPPDDAPPKQCPTCGQDLPDEAAERVATVLEARGRAIEQQRQRIADNAQRKAAAEARVDELKHELDTTPAAGLEELAAAGAATARLPRATGEHAAAVAQVAAAAGLVETLAVRQQAHDQAVVQAGQAREQLTVLTVELEGAGDQQAALVTLEEEVATLTDGVIEASTRRDSLQGRADQLAVVKEDADAKRKERDTQRADMDLMAELERALGANGVQALLIDAAIPQIVQEANALLALTSAGTTIDLRTQRAGKTTGREIETLDLIVADGSGVRPYELYSGGERFRIDFATRIGLSRLLARRAASPCKTLIVDEGFGSQDGRGRTALLEALAMVQDQFRLVLVITHLDDLREYFPSSVWIEKTPNGSTASLV